MADLFQLLYGRSKKRMRVIMVDTQKKCENYRDARQNVAGWHDIQPAPPGSTVWKQKTASIKGSGSKTNSGPMVVGKGLSGYINKHGFQPNT